MFTPSLCPVCGERTARRRILVTRPLPCDVCALDARRRHWNTYNRKRRERQSLARAAAGVVQVRDDLTPEQIERRYQAALAQIRRRAS